MFWLEGDEVEKILKRTNEVVSVGVVQKVYSNMITVKFTSEVVDLKLNKNKSVNQHTVGLYSYNRKWR